MTGCAKAFEERDWTRFRDRARDSGPTYRLKLKDVAGRLLRDEHVRAHCDEDAINLAMRRLVHAPIVEVWRYARWVCQVQRAQPVLH